MIGAVQAARPFRQILHARCGEFQPHQARDHAADDTGDEREDQIERADVLVVGGHEPAREERGLVIGVMRMVVAVRASERSEEHTSELQSLMRSSYAVFCLKNKNSK